MESKNTKMKTKKNSQPSKWREKAELIVKNKLWIKEAAVISVRIQEALKDQKLTQKALAEKLSVAPQWINRVIKGKENLTLSSIKKIEEALSIQLIEISSQKKKGTIPVIIPGSRKNRNRNQTKEYIYSDKMEVCGIGQVEEIPATSKIIDLHKRA